MFELPVLSALLLQYGYFAVFAGVILGGEILLLAAGFLAAQGYFNVVWVIFLATLAVILVDVIWYIIGRTGRIAFAKKIEKLLIHKKEKTSGLDNLLKKHASKTILLVRFVYGIRAIVLIFAGALKMKFGKFLILNSIGSLVWATVMTLLGYFFGASFDVLKYYIKNGLVFITLALLVGIFVLFIVMYLKKEMFRVVRDEEKSHKKNINSKIKE